MERARTATALFSLEACCGNIQFFYDTLGFKRGKTSQNSQEKSTQNNKTIYLKRLFFPLLNVIASLFGVTVMMLYKYRLLKSKYYFATHSNAEPESKPSSVIEDTVTQETVGGSGTNFEN